MVGAAQDEVMIKTTAKGCLTIHEGFTPNNDGINDTWVVPCLFDTENVVQIYNRWGTLLFEQKNYTDQWDGTYNGNPVPDGTYYYIVKMQKGNLKYRHWNNKRYSYSYTIVKQTYSICFKN